MISIRCNFQILWIVVTVYPPQAMSGKVLDGVLRKGLAAIDHNTARMRKGNE